MIIITVMLILSTICGIRTGAQETVDTDELYGSLGIDDSSVILPDEAEEVLSENDITMKNAGKVAEAAFPEVMKYIFEKYGKKLSFPIRILGIMLGIAVLSAGVKMFSESAGVNSQGNVYEVISTAAAAVLVCVPCAECIGKTAETLKAGGAFMISYVPIYAGIAASSGAVTSAGIYNIAVITAADMAVAFFSGVMLPLTSACMALGIADGLSSDISLGAFTGVINKICSFLMISVMTVFTGMLSMQSSIGTAADGAAAKAAKLAVSNFVPVVGGALSDTYTAVRSGLSLLKKFAGIYGIIAVSAIILPPVIESAALYIAANLASAASDAMGLKNLSALFKNTGVCIGMSLGILLAFGALLIISTGILLSQNPAQ